VQLPGGEASYCLVAVSYDGEPAAPS
jgi:hypothetical protein